MEKVNKLRIRGNDGPPFKGQILLFDALKQNRLQTIKENKLTTTWSCRKSVKNGPVIQLESGPDPFAHDEYPGVPRPLLRAAKTVPKAWTRSTQSCSRLMRN